MHYDKQQAVILSFCHCVISSKISNRIFDKLSDFEYCEYSNIPNKIFENLIHSEYSETKLLSSISMASGKNGRKVTKTKGFTPFAFLSVS